MDVKNREDTDTEETGSAEEADERRVREVKEKVKAAREEPKEEPEEESDEDVEDDSEDDEQGEPTRREKRANRYKEAMERAEAAERRAEALAAQQNQLMRQMLQAQQPREPQVDQRRQIEEEYEAVELDLIDLRSRYSQRAAQYHQQGMEMPREEMRQFIAKQRDLEFRKHNLIGEQFVRERNYGAPDPRMQQIQMEKEIIRVQNQDVFNSRPAQIHADYAFKRMLAEGKPDSLATLQAAVAEARQVVLKKGSPQKPSQNQKAKYTGASTGAGGPAREGGGVPVIKVSPEGRRMADAAFSHIKDDKKRYEAWGRLMYQKEQERRRKPA